MKGILCPVCKTNLHEVTETRGAIRRRKCFNGHPFTTEERVIKVHRREKVRPKVLKLLAANEGLPQRSPERKSVREIAQQLHISVDTVYRIKRGEVAKRSVRNSKGTSK